MSKMTDKEIIKALKCCDDFGWCGQCSLQGVIDCKTALTDNALDLINRQQAEIEKLERVISYLEGVCESTPDKVRAEAIKECLEWVLSLFPKDKNITAISRFSINQKLKEMVGEGK